METKEKSPTASLPKLKLGVSRRPELMIEAIILIIILTVTGLALYTLISVGYLIGYKNGYAEGAQSFNQGARIGYYWGYVAGSNNLPYGMDESTT